MLAHKLQVTITNYNYKSVIQLGRQRGRHLIQVVQNGFVQNGLSLGKLGGHVVVEQLHLLLDLLVAGAVSRRRWRSVGDNVIGHDGAQAGAHVDLLDLEELEQLAHLRMLLC